MIEISRPTDKQQLFVRIAVAIVLPVLIFGFVLSAPAASWGDASSNQSLNQSASLTAPEPDAKIAIYRQPNTEEGQTGYGVNGDAVTVLEQVSDNQSLTWNHIRFDNPPYAEGWVQETFLSLAEASQVQTSQIQTQPSQPNRYLGNRQSQTGGQTQYSQRSQYNQQNSSQTYSHRNQN